MTREEAINWLEAFMLDYYDPMDVPDDLPYEVAQIALTALRPVSRGQVVKVWKGCEYCKKHKIKLVRIEMDYNETPGSPERLNPTRIPKFCPICGAPMTDEAVEMVMERLEALKDGSTTDKN